MTALSWQLAIRVVNQKLVNQLSLIIVNKWGSKAADCTPPQPQHGTMSTMSHTRPPKQLIYC